MVTKLDTLSRIIAFVATAFGAIALLLACVGVGTPNWHVGYQPTSSTAYYQRLTANFFYTCDFPNDVFNNCTSRDSSLYNYPGYSTSLAWTTDYHQRMQNAGGLCIVGILFLLAGTIFTLVMALIHLPSWVNLAAPVLLFLACLFMLAGMAEGARYLMYNGYSAHLFQSAHLFVILALMMSAFVGGRVHSSD